MSNLPETAAPSLPGVPERKPESPPKKPKTGKKGPSLISVLLVLTVLFSSASFFLFKGGISSGVEALNKSYKDMYNTEKKDA